jgi:hypothetical protein
MPKSQAKKTNRVEWSSRRRVRFFDAYDARSPVESFNSICKQHNITIPPATGRDWLRQRESIGEKAYHKTRSSSNILGRNFDICEATLDYILDPENGLSRLDPVSICEKLFLDIHPRTLQASMAKRKHAKRYKRRKTIKIADRNKELRIKYGKLHENKPIRSYWRYIYFTDEVHFDAADLSYSQQYEYAVEGEAENLPIQETGDTNWCGKVHVAGGITYDHKGYFGFYKDPKEPSERARATPKPRKSSVETVEEHRKKVDTFEFEKFKVARDAPKGNAMTIEFYTKEVLPKHIEFLERMKRQYKQDFEFVEDGDPSHGMRTSHNMAANLKRKHSIITHWHPAESPDFNPIEAIWMIIKERLRGRKWRNRDHFKEDILSEWKRITQAQIRKRISEMPRRCKDIQNNGGNRLRSKV